MLCNRSTPGYSVDGAVYPASADNVVASFLENGIDSVESIGHGWEIKYKFKNNE